MTKVVLGESTLGLSYLNFGPSSSSGSGEAHGCYVGHPHKEARSAQHAAQIGPVHVPVPGPGG
jgi:hypothetical protein